MSCYFVLIQNNFYLEWFALDRFELESCTIKFGVHGEMLELGLLYAFSSLAVWHRNTNMTNCLSCAQVSKVDR